MKRKLSGIKKRLNDYDDLDIKTQFAKISTDLDWIKTKLLELSKKQA